MKTKICGAVLLLLALVSLADADHRCRVIRQHHAAVAVEPIYVYALPVIVNAYAVSYDPTAALRIQVEELRRELRERKTTAPAPMPPATSESRGTPELDGLQVLRAECASCHDKAVAANKAKGHVILDGGNLAAMSDKLALKIATKTYLGDMPPNKKLSDEQVGAINQFLDSRK